MAKFYVGQRVKVVRPDPDGTDLAHVGYTGVICILNAIGPCPFTGETKVRHLVDVDGLKCTPGYEFAYFPDQLEPLQPEGWQKTAWEKCAWQPEHLREKVHEHRA